MKPAIRTCLAMVMFLLLAACNDITRESQRVNTDLNLGLEAQLDNRASDAAIHYRHALEYGPNAVAYYNLGLLAQNEGNPVDASARYREALAVEAAYQPALYQLGLISIEIENYEEAVTLFGRLIEVAPEDAAGHWNLSVALSALGREEEATAERAIAIALDPKFGE